MRNLLNFILSLKFSGILLVIIAFATGYATFIENDFGAIAAKAVVYNARWFEIVILLAFINIAWNAFKYNPLKTKRYSVFAFHLSFLIIIIGAGVTRYIGFEGMMSIRENQSSNQILSDETFIQIKCIDGQNTFSAEEKVLFTPITSVKEKIRLKAGENNYTLKTFEYVPNARELMKESKDGPKMLNLSGTINGKFTRFSLFEGESKRLESYNVSFNSETQTPNTFVISSRPEGLFIQLPENGKLINMMSTDDLALYKDSLYSFTEKQVYQVGDQSLVLREYYEHAQMSVESNTDGQNTGLNAVKFTLSNKDGKQIESYAMGVRGYLAPAKHIDFDGKHFDVSYGPKEIDLPFSIKLVDFQLDRYPASNSPSSYASEVILIDDRVNLKQDFRIFMNNVLNYDSYRFFQSSYDKDERGTVLSVNHDWWGMMITYFGYGLMMITMFLAIFEKNTRFQFLIRQKTIGIFTLAFLLTAGLSVLPAQSVSAQSGIQRIEKIPAQHIEKFNNLINQGQSGRFKPMNSVSNETFRKYSRLGSYKGLSPEQVMLGMMIDPNYWMRQELIKVSNDELKAIIGNNNPRATFNNFFNNNQQPAYKLSKYVDEAYRKKPSQRSTLDKDIITVDERVNVLYMAANGHFLNIFPVPGSPNDKWKNPTDNLDGFSSEDSGFIKSVSANYIDALKKGVATNQWEDADFYLDAIYAYQQKFASDEIKDNAHFKMEILYNRFDIFKQLSFINGIFGFILLVLLFIRILWPKFRFKWAINILFGILFLAFIAHTGGLIMRWYIAGHAPWSNGYESMIFIGWASMLAGISFYKKAPIALGATAILTFLILYVAHLSWMNPEITNLVPVLKSYWLTIHVAVITASYGFLALGGFLGILNLIFMLLQTNKNSDRIQVKIKELSRINEASLIAGLYLLTIGTFLGGIWANESWGRYWGWDPKETWTLVTVVIYSFVLHMRLIPGLKSLYAFNVGSIFSYFSVIMTYFGVNYYLSGLHSYAQGDSMPIPNFAFYTVAFLLALSILASYANRKHPIK
ncbi:MAG: cytochrome c biogenesis protein CcsA [Bacteroidales bacterium]|jgi:cytochrome c-type biogenesis protein CcsB|nr:cytochrome c biogenesis protein CcsA [Bacteroidales bacterium]